MMQVHRQQPLNNDNHLLRKRIRDIQCDPLTNTRDKARLVQSLMSSSATCILSRSSNSTSNNESLECTHYDKKCSRMYFECCDVIDPCHRCHMARGQCNLRPARVKSVVCNECNFSQAPAQDCINCGVRMGRNYCDICKIWTPLDIYHCDDCGFCRVGKANEVFHCHTCEACFGIDGRDQHRCAKIQLKDACCPMCLESVHSAQKPSSILPCGHVLHADCWKEAARKGEFRCPTCRKSLFDMRQLWENIRRSIALQPIPKNFFPIRVGDLVESPYGPFQVTERRTFSDCNGSAGSPSGTKVLCEGVFPGWHLADGEPARAVLAEEILENQRKVRICCYDCEAKSTTKFHFLGLECPSCKGFNTCQL